MEYETWRLGLPCLFWPCFSLDSETPGRWHGLNASSLGWQTCKFKFSKIFTEPACYIRLMTWNFSWFLFFVRGCIFFISLLMRKALFDHLRARGIQVSILWWNGGEKKLKQVYSKRCYADMNLTDGPFFKYINTGLPVGTEWRGRL